jgi:hypothetical protein
LGKQINWNLRRLMTPIAGCGKKGTQIDWSNFGSKIHVAPWTRAMLWRCIPPICRDDIALASKLSVRASNSLAMWRGGIRMNFMHSGSRNRWFQCLCTNFRSTMPSGCISSNRRQHKEGWELGTSGTVSTIRMKLFRSLGDISLEIGSIVAYSINTGRSFFADFAL